MTDGRIAFYITGHGLGHATRSCAVISSLLSRGYQVDVISTAAPWFLKEELLDVFPGAPIRVFPRSLDSGAKQLDAIRVDPFASLNEYFNTVHSNRSTLLAEEVVYLRRERVRLVLTDTSALAVCAAADAGVRVALLTNFTWDWIYSQMLDSVMDAYQMDELVMSPDELAEHYGEREAHWQKLASFRSMVSDMADDYALADSYLQYPGSCPEPHSALMRKRVRPIPLLARLARRLPMQQWADWLSQGNAKSCDNAVMCAPEGGSLGGQKRKDPRGFYFCFYSSHKIADPMPYTLKPELYTLNPKL